MAGPIDRSPITTKVPRLATYVVAACVAGVLVTGLLAIHWQTDAPAGFFRHDLQVHGRTYALVFVATTAILSIFGSVLNRRAARLVRLATMDPLTGLHNRRAFEHRLDEEVRRARRYCTPLTLLMIDLDGLKTVNDTYGHVTGDQVLRAAAQALVATLREGCDFGARWGGDEFAILAPNTTEGAAWTLAERMLARVRQHESPNATVSIGIATLEPNHGGAGNAHSLLEAADAAMYQAKAAGANRICGEHERPVRRRSAPRSLQARRGPTQNRH